jgi:hypothetical protein
VKNITLQTNVENIVSIYVRLCSLFMANPALSLPVNCGGFDFMADLDALPWMSQ